MEKENKLIDNSKFCDIFSDNMEVFNENKNSEIKRNLIEIFDDKINSL